MAPMSAAVESSRKCADSRLQAVNSEVKEKKNHYRTIARGRERLHSFAAVALTLQHLLEHGCL